MTMEEIIKAVKHIEDIQEDDERAHGEEDILRSLFIEWLAYRDDDIGEMARNIFSTEKLTFKRWCG